MFITILKRKKRCKSGRMAFLEPKKLKTMLEKTNTGNRNFSNYRRSSEGREGIQKRAKTTKRGDGDYICLGDDGKLKYYGKCFQGSPKMIGSE